MSEGFIQKHQVFFENLSRKIISQINYADLIDESLSESSVTSLLAEAIEKSELEKLQKMAEEAKTDIDSTIAIAKELDFNNTVAYLEELKGELPSTFSLVKLTFSGDNEAAAEEIGKVTSVVSKMNLARDSFNDAVLLFGTELEKLPFSQDTTWQKFEKEQADAQGQLTIPGLEDVKVGEFITQVKEDPLIDVVKMAQEYEGLEGLEFPDEDLLRSAAEKSYKPPPEPDGFWGKVTKFFGGGDLEAAEFADDIMSTSLAKLIEKAKEIKAAQAEAEKDAKETTALMDDLGKDVQALGQGDTSVIAAPSGGGGEQAATQTTTVNMPGAGDVPLTPQTMPQVAPGFDQKPEKAAGKKMIPIPELEKTVTRPEEVEEGEWLAALVNDDPKSNVVFFDPEAAEKAAKEAEKAAADKGAEGGEGGAAPTDSPESGDDSTKAKPKKEGWIHKRKITDWLFESSSRKKAKWVHQTSLKSALFTEAIFYKDIAKALKAQGVEDVDLAAKAIELAKRLENQYDVTVSDLPEIKVDEKDVEAAEQIQQAGLTAQDLKDILKQQGDMNKDNMEMLKDILASKDESEVQRALARASEKGIKITNVLTATAEASADAKSGTGEEKPTDDKKSGKPRDRTGPPSEKMTGRGKEVGLEPKEGETGEKFGARVRKEEEKQGKRTKKKKEKPAKGSGSSSSASASASASSTSEALWLQGNHLNETLIHSSGTLTEILLGPKSKVKNNHLDEEPTDRWAQLAGLEDE